MVRNDRVHRGQGTLHKGAGALREGQARPVDWYSRPEGLVCGGRSGCSAVSVGARQAAETGRRCASAARQRTRRELPRGFRQVSGLVEQVGTTTLSASAFQDNDFRLRHRLHRLRQPHRRWHGHERRQQPQLRGRYPHRRTIACGCRRRPPRQRLARSTMYQVQTKSLLRRQDFQIITKVRHDVAHLFCIFAFRKMDGINWNEETPWIITE